MARIEDLLQRIEDRERALEAMSPAACRETAELLRGVKPQLSSERQRQIADEIADEFEARAAQEPRSRAS